MFKGHIKLVLVIYMLLSAVDSVGGNMRITHLSNVNQLPSNTINAICQDQKGFIWIGTENGLCRWDGSTMEVFESSIEIAGSLPSKSIIELFVDRSNRIWVITSQGLRYYDYNKNEFSSVKNDITCSEVCAIAESSNGLYLGAGDILYIYNDEEDRFEPVMVHGREVRNRITSLAVDENGGVWFGTKSDGLAHLNESHTVLIHLHKKNNVQNWLISNQINALLYSQNGTLWIGTNDRGVCSYSIENNSFKILSELENVSVSSFCEDSNRNLWIGTNQGLFVLDQLSGKIIAHHEKQQADQNYLSDNLITAVLCDREQNMLVGTRYGGINIFPYMFRQFSFYDWGEGERYLSGRTVRQILPDGKGNLWIATEDGNLNYLNRSNNSIKKLMVKGEEYTNPYALLMDKKGRLWIGTTTNGIFCYHPQTGRSEQFTVELYPGLSTNRILSLLEDKDGRLWVGTASGLVVYDESNNIFIQFDPFRFRKQSIDHLMMDDNGNVWIATHAQGLFVYDAAKKSIRKVEIPNDEDETVRRIGHINYVYQDSHKRIWISTNYDGLVCFNPATKCYYSFTTRDQLLSNTVYSVIEDGNGNIWASTDNGLSCYYEPSGSFINYSVSEGLPNKQFSNNSAYCDSDGYLFFGTINGMVSFHPDSLRMPSRRAQVELTSLRIQGENNRLNLFEDKDFASGGKIHLNSSQARSFSISYTVPTISHASSLFFATSFGTETKWNYVGRQKQINFANLAPGEYLLQLKASFNNRWDGDEPISTIRIIIDPPFWRLPIMYCVYALLLLILAIYAWRSIVARQQRHTAQIAKDLEQKKNMELHNMQMNFFTNISHQLRIPLSLIIGPIESMIAQNRFSGDTQRRMKSLAKNAEKMKYMIDELLHFTQIKTSQNSLHLCEGDINDFILDIAEGFQLLAEGKKLKYDILIPKDPTSVWFSPRDVEKIVFNLLSNAFKYTKEGTITISSSIDSSTGPTMLYISVEDTGIGMDAKQLEHIFEAYYQINDWNSIGDNGFGIGLALTKELILLHKGNIKVTSTPGVGSRFDVILGVDKSLFNAEQLSKEPYCSRDEKEYKYLLSGIVPEQDNDAIATKPSSHEKRHTILVAEDEGELLDFMKELFQKEYNVLLAKNGKEGWEVATKHVPDVIISDVMMPEMNGFELVHKLKNNIATSHIQVVLLTAKSGNETQIEGYQSGADFYLEKPFHPAALYEQVKNLIKSRERLIHRYMAGQIDASEIVNNSLDSKFISRIDNIIKKNLSREDFSVNDLTLEAGISRTQLHMKLKSLVGMSTTEYINHCRMREAVVLMKAGYRVSEAAYSTGFSSPNYFTRIFKSKYGMLPSQITGEKKTISK